MILKLADLQRWASVWLNDRARIDDILQVIGSELSDDAWAEQSICHRCAILRRSRYVHSRIVHDLTDTLQPGKQTLAIAA